AYWVMPTLIGSRAAISRIAGRGVFGNTLFDLPHAIANVDSSWTGHAPNETFVKQPFPWYFWLVPALAVAGLIVLRRLSKRERLLFAAFAFVTLLGIFLTKQAAAPLPSSYQWLYDHVRGFSLFREASKFYLLTSFGYAGLVSLT